MGSNKIANLARNLVLASGIIGLLAATVALGQPAKETSSSSTEPWPTRKKIKYPAQGQVNAGQLNVRAGSGSNYYICDLLPRGTKVVVRDERLGWLKIDAPEKCFSLIAAEYVQKSGPAGQAIVTGSNIRVRAGASNVKQNYAVQCKLNKGDTVRIIGRTSATIGGEKVALYKIQPPPGKAFFWVFAKYITHIGPYAPETPAEPGPVIEVPDTPDIEEILELPNTTTLPKSTDRTELKNLDEALRIEMRRPIAQRRLAEHLAKYLALNTKTKSNSIAELTKKRIKEIKRHMDTQIALQKSIQIKKSYDDSQKRMIELINARNRTTTPGDKEAREVTGRLKPSYVFRSRGAQRWRLVDAFTGRNICYLLPGTVNAQDLKSNQGRIVTVSGPAVFDPRIHLDLVAVDKMRSSNK